jgi:hypothetical protein
VEANDFRNRGADPARDVLEVFPVVDRRHFTKPRRRSVKALGLRLEAVNVLLDGIGRGPFGIEEHQERAVAGDGFDVAVEGRLKKRAVESEDTGVERRVDRVSELDDEGGLPRGKKTHRRGIRRRSP